MTTGHRWAIASAVLAGLAVGLGVFTFGYARGYSYLGHDPAACANCHVMSEHYSAWLTGSHHAAASCNDCHTPHSLIPRYAVKARNGFWHSFYFTFGGYPDPLRITEPNRRVTEAACRSCHTDMIAAIDRPPPLAAHVAATRGESISCIQCHGDVGHWVR